jgi:hypothetical protein
MAYWISGNDCLGIARNRNRNISGVEDIIRYNSGEYMRDILLQIQKKCVGIRTYDSQFWISKDFLIYLE